jgi:hypothetical protein
MRYSFALARYPPTGNSITTTVNFDYNCNMLK